MHTLDLSKLIVDLLLTGSLVAIATRMVRSPAAAPSRQGAELEATLRGLVREAETQSRTLNDQLMKREQTLQKLLAEIQESETRVRAASENYAERGAELASHIEKADRAVDEVNRALELLKRELAGEERSPEPAPRKTAPPDAPRRQASPPQPQAARPASHLPIELSVEQAPAPYPFEQEAEPAPPRFEQAVIPARSSGTLADWSLAAHRARTQSAASESDSLGHDGFGARDTSDEVEAVTDVYNSAEQLLKAGRGVSSVAQTTKLPLEEVRKLSLMVEKERVLEETKSHAAVVVADPRLGVLGKGKNAPIGG